jgi:hypothetical protein
MTTVYILTETYLFQCTENLNTFWNNIKLIWITYKVNTDAKKGHSGGIHAPRLAKNAFAIQHLLHHSIRL